MGIPQNQSRPSIVIIYIKCDILSDIYYGDYAESDLEIFSREGLVRNDGDLLRAFIQELSTSQSCMNRMTDWRGENHFDPRFNVSALSVFQDDGYNIYRIRPLFNRLQIYRILYAYDNEYDNFHILAVVEKAINPEVDPLSRGYYDYSINHPISQRIRAEYEQYNFPRI